MFILRDNKGGLYPSFAIFGLESLCFSLSRANSCFMIDSMCLDGSTFSNNHSWPAFLNDIHIPFRLYIHSLHQV